MTTYADFQSQVRRSLEEPTEGVWKDSSFMYWTNETAAQMARRNKPTLVERTFNTVAATAAYALLAVDLEFLKVTADNDELLRIPLEEYGTLDVSTSGKPYWCAMGDGQMFLYPTPDAVYAMRLFRYRTPDLITATTDSMPFSSQYNTAIEYGVLARAFEQINDWQSAEMYRGRFEAAVDEMLRQEIMEKGARRDTSPREVY